MRGRCPRAPGIYRFALEWLLSGWRAAVPPGHSSPGPALGSHPCVALSSAQVSISIYRLPLIVKKTLLRNHKAGYK